jgi:hypothetical protein
MVNTDGDLLNPNSWTKVGPVFQQDPSEGIYATGHNSFTTSPDGTEDWIAYHGRLSTDGSKPRHMFIQKFSWDGDIPEFGKPAPMNTDLSCPSDTGTIINIQAYEANDLFIYPNPASEYLQVELPGNSCEAEIQVLNIMGQTVRDISYSDGKLNITELEQGIYLLKIDMGKKQYYCRFLKQNG